MADSSFEQKTGLKLFHFSGPTLFDATMNHILNVEGRHYTDHPMDKGGPTKFGITLKTLEAYRGTKVTAADVQNLQEEEAKRIFKARYFDRMNLGFIEDPRKVLCLMDQGVNRGTSTAITMAQVMLNRQSGMKLAEDGVLGPKTKAGIDSVNTEFFCREYIQLAQHGYVDIVKRKNDQLVFLTGWMNRTHILQDLVWDGRTTGTPVIVPAPVIAPPTSKGNRLSPYNWAKGELGQSEIAGSKDNARIVFYHSFTSLKATDDETPWCSSFVCAALEENGFKSTRSAAAKSYIGFMAKGDGSVGDIAVLKRPGGHHVAFINKKFVAGSSTIELLGGNQSNKVRVSNYSAADLLDIRRVA